MDPRDAAAMARYLMGMNAGGQGLAPSQPMGLPPQGAPQPQIPPQMLAQGLMNPQPMQQQMPPGLQGAGY